MKIILGFSKSKSLSAIGSKIIALVEKRDFSHSYIRFIEPNTKIEMVSQASHGMVNLTALDIFVQNNEIIREYEVECTALEFFTLLTFIYAKSGTPYSRLQILAISIKKLFHLNVGYSNGGLSYICSEWAYHLMHMVNHIVTDEPEDYITPSDLNELAIKFNLKKVK